MTRVCSPSFPIDTEAFMALNRETCICLCNGAPGPIHVCVMLGEHPGADPFAHRVRHSDRCLHIQILHHTPEVCNDAL